MLLLRFRCWFQERTLHRGPGLCRFPHEPRSVRHRLFSGLCLADRQLFHLKHRQKRRLTTSQTRRCPEEPSFHHRPSFQELCPDHLQQCPCWRETKPLGADSLCRLFVGSSFARHRWFFDRAIVAHDRPNIGIDKINSQEACRVSDLRYPILSTVGCSVDCSI